jgi:hypothetical protein
VAAGHFWPGEILGIRPIYPEFRYRKNLSDPQGLGRLWSRPDSVLILSTLRSMEKKPVADMGRLR